jgi:hypothetical protein
MSSYHDTYKQKGYDDDDNFRYDYSTMERSALIQVHGDESKGFSNTCGISSQYPGNRRFPMSKHSIPDGSILVQTAGNALQAIPQQQTSELIEVTVPVGTVPGDTIHVLSPYNPNDIIAAVIPDDMNPGQTFYVQCPAKTTTSSLAVAVPTAASSSSDESITANAVLVHNSGDLRLYDNSASSTINHRG